MAVLTVQDAAVSGITPAPIAGASGGDLLPNNGLVIVIARNTGGAPVTVTADDKGTPAPVGASAFTPDVAVTVPATNGERILGPYPEWRFNDTAGRVQLTYSVNPPTGLTLTPIRVRT